MMKKFVVVGLVLLFATSCFAVTKLYAFKVTDHYRNPLLGVQVRINNTSAIFYTDGRGSTNPLIYVPGELPPTSP